MSAEAELEAAVWSALSSFKVTCDEPVGLVVALKTAAKAYAAGDSEELTEMRRALLHRESAPRVADRKAARKARAQEGTTR